jgi:hypothetical protein
VHNMHDRQRPATLWQSRTGAREEADQPTTVSASFLDLSSSLVYASLDQQFRGLPVPWLIEVSLEEADRQTHGLGEQVGASQRLPR